MKNKCNKMLLLGALLGLVTLGQSVEGRRKSPSEISHRKLAEMDIGQIQDKIKALTDSIGEAVKKIQDNPNDNLVKGHLKQNENRLQEIRKLNIMLLYQLNKRPSLKKV